MQTKAIGSTKENEQSGSVKKFFDGHATEYQEKYSRKNKFYEYFFFERLEKATESFDLEGKSILDIGAGTGPLYDFLLLEGKHTFSTYTATDLSDGMLEQSNIPTENRIAGDFTQMHFNQKFDFIYMLGVSTYLSLDILQKHLEKIESMLVPNGVFIVTFTNKNGLDTIIRTALGPLRKLVAGRNRVMSQEFSTWYYSKNEIEALIPKGMAIKKITGLNHTIFPLSRIFPRLSIFLAKKIFGETSGRLNRFLSSDLLVFVKKGS
ncbi:MAG: methyltransferase [Cytophagales bacterium]|nr:methyltransferase [Cytophagales bacterium]